VSKKSKPSDGCGGGTKGGSGYMSLLTPAGDDAPPARPGALEAVRLVLRSMRTSENTTVEDNRA
jgi:hypothetical protein